MKSQFPTRNRHILATVNFVGRRQPASSRYARTGLMPPVNVVLCLFVEFSPLNFALLALSRFITRLSSIEPISIVLSVCQPSSRSFLAALSLPNRLPSWNLPSSIVPLISCAHDLSIDALPIWVPARSHQPCLLLDQQRLFRGAIPVFPSSFSTNFAIYFR